MTPEFSQAISAILCCPSCRGEIREHQDGFRCGRCEQIYPRVDGLLRFVDAEYYTGSFGYQWHEHADARWGEESELTFQRKTGFSPAELKGKLVLDVGCGNGRFADVASRLGAHVVGIDLSTAAEVAARNLADRPSVAILQADALRLPFKPGSFDYIYSIGVLHHTPDCERAFKALPSLLKPDGEISIWVYSAYNKYYRMSDQYRKITSRLPPPWVHAFCRLAGPVGYADRGLRKIPMIGRPVSAILRALLPMNQNNPDHRLRVLATLDWYAPKYQSKHTYEEVFRWFESCGLQDLHVLHQPVSVRGKKAAVREVPELVSITRDTGNKNAA